MSTKADVEEGAPLGKLASAIHLVVLALPGVALVPGVDLAGETVAGSRCVGLVAPETGRLVRPFFFLSLVFVLKLATLSIA